MQIDPNELRAHPSNSRVHNREQLDALKRSILEFGFTKPIVVDEENVILAGHGAWTAAKELKSDGKLVDVPVHRHAGLSPEQKRAYLIADNRLAELSAWDKPLLAAELTALDEYTFSEIELRSLFGPAQIGSAGSSTIGGSRFLLQIEVADEKRLRELFNELSERGLECRILS
jgi:ParB family chromosome partitioning protein